jgi:TRAP-type C4-dicarboxylate transport system permease small subunit
MEVVGLSMRQKTGDAVTRVINALGMISGAVILFLGLINFFEITMRSLSHPTVWVFPLSIWLTIWLSWMGASYTMQEEGHVNMQLLITNLSVSKQRFFAVLISVISLIYLLILFWQGCRLVAESIALGRTTIGLIHIPTALVQLAVPVGTFFVIIVAFRQLAGRFNEYRTGKRGWMSE